MLTGDKTKIYKFSLITWWYNVGLPMHWQPVFLAHSQSQGKGSLFQSAAMRECWWHSEYRVGCMERWKKERRRRRVEFSIIIIELLIF